MNLHEYQGKSILKSYGVAIQEGIVVDKVEDAVAAAKKLTEETGTSWYVVKAQIHAGGRGKGLVQETGSHGVVLAKGIDQIEENGDADHIPELDPLLALTPLSVPPEPTPPDPITSVYVCPGTTDKLVPVR